MSGKLNTIQDTERIHLSVNDSSTYLIKGDIKNSITLLSPVLISAVTAIPGEMGISLSLARINFQNWPKALPGRSGSLRKRQKT